VRKLFPVRLLLVDQAGFGLTELLVALVVSGVLVIGVAGGYVLQKRTYESETGLRELQMNARVAMDQIARVVRNAGLGCRQNFPPYGSDTLQGVSRSASRVLTAQNRTNGPDTLHVVTGLASRTRVDLSAEANVFRLASVDGFDLGSGRYIYIAPWENNRFQQVQAISDHDVTVSESRPVFAGYKVFRVNLYTITLDSESRDTALDVDGDGSTADYFGDADEWIPNLCIFDNTENLSDESLAQIAEGIEDLQFRYGWDADESGFIEDDEYLDDPVGNEDRIRAVRIYLLVRSLRPDPHFTDDSGSYAVADRTIVLDTNDANGIHSDFDHRYRRQLFVKTVMIRNRNL